MTEHEAAFERLKAIAKRIRPLIAEMGPPGDVIPALLLIMVLEAMGQGTTVEDFVEAVRLFAIGFWPRKDLAELN